MSPWWLSAPWSEPRKRSVPRQSRPVDPRCRSISALVRWVESSTVCRGPYTLGRLGPSQVAAATSKLFGCAARGCEDHSLAALLPGSTDAATNFVTEGPSRQTAPQSASRWGGLLTARAAQAGQPLDVLGSARNLVPSRILSLYTERALCCCRAPLKLVHSAPSPASL